MPLYKTDAIVIGRSNYAEADRIIRLLSSDGDKHSAIAKGSRRLKSRSGGHLELFGEVSLMLVKGKNLDIVSSAQVIWYPQNFTGDYHRLEIAFMMTKMIDRLIIEHHPQPDLYNLLKEGLVALDQGTNDPVLILWYKLRLLDILGYTPELRRCLICGESSGTSSYFFSLERGGIVDIKCKNPDDSSIQIDEIKLWRLLLVNTYDTISSVSDASKIATLTLSLCDNFYEYHLGQKFIPSITD